MIIIIFVVVVVVVVVVDRPVRVYRLVCQGSVEERMVTATTITITKIITTIL